MNEIKEFDSIRRKFEAMGARARIEADAGAERLRIDLVREKRGEVFHLQVPRGVELTVAAIQAGDRHLVLQARTPDDRGRATASRFLCGHDERHWFVAAVPSVAGGVEAARQALKPAWIRAAEARAALKTSKRRARRNAVSVRQGEWFFVPAPDLVVPAEAILKNEPISRGRGSKPHRVQFLYRSGGTNVWVRRGGGRVLTEAEYRERLFRDPKASREYRMARQVTGAYGKGWVRHPDHATVILPDWHRIELNTEGALGSSGVAFLD